MTRGDAARLLALAAVYDRRTVGELDAAAWADALDGLDPRECAEAIRAHYRDSAAWVMPAHIRERAAMRRRAAHRQQQAANSRAELTAARSVAITDRARIHAIRAAHGVASTTTETAP